MSYKDMPVFLIAGPGGSGKDTLARMLGRALDMKYIFSTSFGAAEAFWKSIRNGQQVHRGIYHDTYKDFNSFYNDRVNKREAWADYIAELTAVEPTGIYEYLLSQGNQFLVGIRRTRELEAIEAQGWIDLRIWIESPEAPPDPTQEYGPERCDISIVNNQNGIENLRRKVLTLVRWLHLPQIQRVWKEQEALAGVYREHNAQLHRENLERAASGLLSDKQDQTLVRPEASDGGLVSYLPAERSSQAVTGQEERPGSDGGSSQAVNREGDQGPIPVL